MSTTQQKTLAIDGMHCEHCVDVVQQVLGEMDGVTVQDVEIGTARIAFDAGAVSEADLAAAIEDAGYELAS